MDTIDKSADKRIQFFDFDGVLFDHTQTWKLFPAASIILRELGDLGYTLALVSKREANSQYSEQILSVLRESKIDKYFSHVIIQNTSKTIHISTVLKAIGNEKLKCVLYDDDELNIKECSQAGYSCVHIDTKTGINSGHIVY